MAIRANPIDDALIRKMLYWLEFDLQAGTVRWKRRRAGNIKVGQEAGIIRNDGYRNFRFNRRLYMTHRVLVAFSEWMCGREIAPEMQIDHIDGDPLNNCIDNLRIVPQELNQRNARMRRDNTSGVSGVFWCENARKWWARVGVDKKYVSLGYFDRKKDAEDAVKAFRAENGFTERHGEPA